MAKFTITDKLIRDLQPPQAGNQIVYGDVPGFGVRISSGGAIAFVFNYRIHGRKRRFTIGSYPAWTPTEARDKALELRKAVNDGMDPLEKKQQDRTAPTLNDLIAEYLADPETLKKAPSTLRNERQMMALIIAPRLGQLQVAAIGQSDLKKLHWSLRGTPYRANRVLAQLSILFSFAIDSDRGWRTDNPARGIKKYSEKKRECWLTDEQLMRLSSALDSYQDQNAANAIRLLILTGAREGEVLQAQWEEFDLTRGIWIKPSHHTKQKKDEHVPLSRAALELLKAMKPRLLEGPLFPGAKIGGARVTIRRPWMQVLKAAGLTLRIHDLRHNFASRLVSEGVSLHIVGKLLGHTQAATTHRYAHVADSPQREAANRFPNILATTTVQ